MPRNHLKRWRDTVFNEYLNLPDDIRQSTDDPVRRVMSVGDRVKAILQKRRPVGKDQLRRHMKGGVKSVSDVLIHDVGGTPRKRTRSKKLVTRRKRNDRTNSSDSSK